MCTQDGACTARPWTARAGLLALAAACLLARPGCGSSTDGLQPVHGRVYYRGTPLAGGTIVFTPDPDRGGAGPLAYAEIGAMGTTSSAPTSTGSAPSSAGTASPSSPW